MLKNRYLLMIFWKSHGIGNEMQRLFNKYYLVQTTATGIFCRIDSGFLWWLSKPVISKMGCEYPWLCTQQSILVQEVNIFYMINK